VLQIAVAAVQVLAAVVLNVDLCRTGRHFVRIDGGDLK
jgi:hypothetical protein